MSVYGDEKVDIRSKKTGRTNEDTTVHYYDSGRKEEQPTPDPRDKDNKRKEEEKPEPKPEPVPVPTDPLSKDLYDALRQSKANPNAFKLDITKSSEFYQVRRGWYNGEWKFFLHVALPQVKDLAKEDQLNLDLYIRMYTEGGDDKLVSTETPKDITERQFSVQDGKVTRFSHTCQIRPLEDKNECAYMIEATGKVLYQINLTNWSYT